MLHVRVISPAAHADDVVRIADASPAVVNILRVPGAALSPRGDLVEFDVAREAANDVLDELSALGLRDTGGITVEQLDVSLSAAADAAETRAPGEGDDAVVWAELSARTSADARLTWAFLAFLTLATQIAAIGDVLDQPVLIVGAMVLGPEFGPVAAMCLGLLRWEGRVILPAARSLLIGFAVAIATTLLCALVGRGLGWVEPGMLESRPLTDFIVHPDKWSFIVALLAGVAGILSLTAGKSSVLVGVFISVTTVPAAGNAAVAIALGHGGEVAVPFVQLGLNLAGMLISGTLTLLAQRTLWRRFGKVAVVRGTGGHGIDRSPR
ncbi:DUF389 domain-containing protein [Streptomyces sp. NRRL F-5126]|uniref:DUF389 domain-containing protein n=1 Tax=Streptomyces sp. NRRL F-5126 TaxID=1463857 RepID=UPI00068F4FCD|nr:DUF389 domain-containing protein [Streptomyces sp. NRRL F-5126]